MKLDDIQYGQVWIDTMRQKTAEDSECRWVNMCEPSTLELLLHLFNSPFSRTAWVSQYQKGKTSLHLNEARDDEVLRWQ